MNLSMKSRFALLGLVSGLLMTPAHAQFTALSSSVPNLVGNQTFGGLLAQDFTVNSTISVTSLGVFDSAGDGSISNNLRAFIYSFGSNSVVATLTVPAGTGYTSTNGYIFQSIAPVALGPGQYSIAAWGFASGTPNYNSAGGPTAINTNTGGGRISFGQARYNFAQQNPSGTDILENPTARYGAGSFIFTAGTAPEPGSLCFFAFGIAAIGIAKRKRK